MRPIPGLTSTTGPLATFLATNPHAFTRDELLAHWTHWALKAAIRRENAIRILPGHPRTRTWVTSWAKRSTCGIQPGS